MQPEPLHPHCEHCDYDLQGLVEPRCPECGNDFDPVLLTADWAAHAGPVTPWEQSPSWRSFFATVRLVLLPTRPISRRLGRLHDSKAASAFGRRSRCVAALVFVVLTIIAAALAAVLRDDELILPVFGVLAMSIGIAVCAYFAMWVCEVWLDHILSTWLGNHLVDEAHNRCLIAYLAAHSVMLGTTAGVTAIAEIMKQACNPFTVGGWREIIRWIQLFTLALCGAAIVYWMVEVSRGIRRRYRGLSNQLEIAATVIVVSLMAIVLTVVLLLVVVTVLRGTVAMFMYDW